MLKLLIVESSNNKYNNKERSQNKNQFYIVNLLMCFHLELVSGVLVAAMLRNLNDFVE